jgi:hypothetical protein
VRGTGTLLPACFHQPVSGKPFQQRIRRHLLKSRVRDLRPEFRQHRVAEPTLAAATGITNKSLRALITRLLNAPYAPGQMTHDLRRLRLAGLIQRIEHTNRYFLTPDGIKFAVFYTKLHNRLLRPLMAADQPQDTSPVCNTANRSTSPDN